MKKIIRFATNDNRFFHLYDKQEWETTTDADGFEEKPLPAGEINLERYLTDLLGNYLPDSVLVPECFDNRDGAIAEMERDVLEEINRQLSAQELEMDATDVRQLLIAAVSDIDHRISDAWASEEKMTFTEWRKKHRLTQTEAAKMLGVVQGTIANAEYSGRQVGPWEAFARLAENELPEVKFSTEQTSYNQPLALFGGDKQPYGPADVIRGDGRIAAHVVALWALQRDRAAEEYAVAKRFLSFWPDGPQLK